MNGSGLQEGWHGTLVLAHFCEVHGPSIVYCTQMFAVTSPLYSLSKESEEKTEDDFPKTRPTEETTVKTSSQKAKSGSCCDVNESQGYLSFESVLNCYLISHRNPQPLFYSKIRTACIRSLSCEVTPNREGPLLFCEEADCLCALSYVFRISDSQARGFTRSYSLILLTPDKMRLVSSVRYIIAALKEFSDQLKAKANIAFELERVNNDGAFVSKTRQLGFPGGRYIRSDAKKLRSLTELLSMPDLFLRLHSRNSFLLRGWYSKYVEITLGISTSKSTNGVSLENLVDQALQSWSESETDGVPKSDRNFFEVSQKTEFQDLKRMIQDFSQGEKLTETYSNLLSWLGPTNMRNLIYNILTGNQIIVQAVNILPIIPIMRNYFHSLVVR
jgi:folliculin